MQEPPKATQLPVFPDEAEESDAEKPASKQPKGKAKGHDKGTDKGPPGLSKARDKGKKPKQSRSKY